MRAPRTASCAPSWFPPRSWPVTLPRPFQGLQVPLDGMPDVIPGVELATKLHLTPRVGGRHPGDTRPTDLVGLPVTQLRRCLRVGHEVETRGAATHACRVGLDHRVAGGAEDVARLGDHPLGVAEVTGILDGD